MPSHEYRVLPAPRRGVRARGARRPEDRFARAVEEAINRMARDGWEYVRTDTLPSEEKRGWFSRRETVFQTLLVFRRALAAAEGEGPRAMPAAVPVPVAAPAPVAMPHQPPGPAPAPRVAARRFTPAPPPANEPSPGPAPALTLVEPPPAPPPSTPLAAAAPEAPAVPEPPEAGPPGRRDPRHAAE